MSDDLRKPDPGEDHGGHRARQKERLLREGLDSFAAHEVMELLLYYGIPMKDTNALAHRLVDRFGNFANALDSSVEDLMEVKGMTRHAAILVHLTGRIAHRYQKERCTSGTRLTTSAQLGQFLAPYFLGRQNESVMLLSLNSRSQLINASRIFEGSVNSAQFNFRTVLRQALRDNASRIVIAHNHPNGYSFPSAADLETTYRIVQILSMADIRTVDHLIFSREDYISLMDTALTRPLFVIRPSPLRGPLPPETDTLPRIADVVEQIIRKNEVHP